MGILQCEVKAPPGAATSHTITFNSGTTAGSTIILIVLNYSSGASATVTDSSTATLTAGLGFDTTLRTGCWYRDNVGSGVTSITWDTGASSNNPVLVAIEYAGLLTTGSYDTGSRQSQAGVTSFSSGNSATTAQADEWAVGFCYEATDANFTFTYDSPWVALSDDDAVLSDGEKSFTSYATIQLCTRVLSSTGAYAYSGTVSSSATVRSGIAIFKLAGLTNPVLSSPGAVNLTQTTATPQVTITWS